MKPAHGGRVLGLLGVAWLAVACAGAGPGRREGTPSVYPKLPASRIALDIDLDGWAIVPGDPDVVNRWEALGRAWELCFGKKCRAQWLEVRSDGATVHLRPHYERSSWDDFYVDARGKLSATGLNGWFPFTLGSDASNRAGVVSVLRAAAEVVSEADPPLAKLLRRIADRIESPGET